MVPDKKAEVEAPDPERVRAYEEFTAEQARIAAEQYAELDRIQADQTERAKAMPREAIEAELARIAWDKRVAGARQRGLAEEHNVYLALDALPPSTGRLVKLRLGGAIGLSGESSQNVVEDE